MGIARDHRIGVFNVDHITVFRIPARTHYYPITSRFNGRAVGSGIIGSLMPCQQDLVIRVSQAYFDVLTAQDNVELFQNKKALIKQQLQAAQDLLIGLD